MEKSYDADGAGDGGAMVTRFACDAWNNSNQHLVGERLIMRTAIPAMKARGFLLLFSLVVCALAIGLLVVVESATGIRYSDYIRVQKGMTVGEVEAILGVPGTEYPDAGVNTFAWHADDGALVTVQFNQNGHAQRIYRYASAESLWQKLLRLVHLRERQEPAMPEFPQ